MFTILGAGLSGICVADHLRKLSIPFVIFEAKEHGGGHIHSRVVDGFTWDEGPHVSFTKHQYVKDYFAENCSNEFLEYPTKPTNYFKNNWIPHPAQSNMYAVPEPLQTECVEDIIKTRSALSESFVPKDYQEWINYAFGRKFAATFSEAYTLKYWTAAPNQLTTDWIGKRIFFPELADMVDSAKGPLEKQTHYISKVRYPLKGGYYNYIKSVEQKIDIVFNSRLSHISFLKKELTFENRERRTYEKLISTLPLPELIINSDAPEEIKRCAVDLKCSKVLIINVIVNHPAVVDNHWIYVYDEKFYSTRINFTELLSHNNGIKGKCGIQVEVYFSDYRKLDKPVNHVAAAVIEELIAMKLVKDAGAVVSYHTQWLEWANVIFDKNRETAQNKIWEWLNNYGLIRENDDLEPMTDWDNKKATNLGDLIFAGRFAQWKYYWTDDCVLRGKFIAEMVNMI